MLLWNISLLQQVWGGDIMSAFPRSAPPDHIEGAHPLLGGEIRFLLFWLAPPCPALHFSTTTCYYQSNYCRVCGLFLWTAARYNFLSLKSQLCWLSVWLVALKPGTHKCVSLRACAQMCLL